MAGLGNDYDVMTPSTNTQPARPTTDPRTLFQAAVSTARQTIAAIEPTQMQLPTPCEAFDVRAMLGHALGVVHRVAALGEGKDPFSVRDQMNGIDDADWLTEWDVATHRFQAAWADDAVLLQQMVLPWAVLPGAAAAAMYTSELTVHTWDLAVATGQHPNWSSEALQVSLEAMQEGLPAEGRIQAFEAVRANMPEGEENFEYPFAAAVPVPDTAPLIDRLVAWTGRIPR